MEDLYISTNQYLPLHDDAKLHMGKKSIQSARETNGFKVIEYKKFINMTSDSTLLLTFKKPPVFEFGVVLKKKIQLSEKTIKILLLFPITNLCEARFLHTLQFKQHIVTDRMQKHI